MYFWIPIDVMLKAFYYVFYDEDKPTSCYVAVKFIYCWCTSMGIIFVHAFPRSMSFPLWLVRVLFH
jgi:hypothetical protein